MLDHRVADDQLHIIRQRQSARFKRSTVEHYSVIGLSKASNKLIHQSGARADEFVFGLLTDFRELQPVNLHAGNIQQGQSRGNFDRRR